MQSFTLLFPKTEPIIVSRILRVHGSSGHEPSSKNLKKKQGTDGGVSISSPMLKLVKDIESNLTSVLHAYTLHTFFLALPPLFMKKDGDPLFMESG